MRSLTWLTLCGAALVVVVAAAGCSPITYDYSKEPDPRKHEFVIGPSDALKITVWKNPDLSGDARVRPDGTITMPLIGDITASGRTPSQLRDEIRHKLAQYVKDESAAVSVAVSEVNSYHFTVAGNVEHGGVFTSKVYVTVADAVALAGGLNKFADPKRLVIVRHDDAGSRRVPIDYNRISSGEHPEENLVLLPDDHLFAQ
jgi:polysaccharide export outer membrane protein